MGFSLPLYQAASENFSSRKMISGRGEKGEQKKNNAFAYNSVKAVVKWEGKVSFGDVSLQLPVPGFQQGPHRGQRAGQAHANGAVEWHW